MSQPPPGYPEPAASQPTTGHPHQGFPQQGYAPPAYGQPGQPYPGQPHQQGQSGQPYPGQPHQGQPGQFPPGQYPAQPYPGPGQRSGSSPARAAKPRPARPPLPVLAVAVVAGLAVLNAVFGFLGSAKFTATGSVATPVGSVYAVAGWIPALLIVSGLAAAATRLKGVSVPTLWAVSAATAVTGGVGALFYLVAREGVDAGLGFVLRSSQSSVTSSASVGLVLIVLFGLVQLVAAVGGLLLTQSPQLSDRAKRASEGGPGVAHRYGPAQAPAGPQGASWGPPTGGQPGYPAPHQQPQVRPDAPGGFRNDPPAPDHGGWPGASPNERPEPPHQGQGGQAWGQAFGPQSGGVAPAGPASSGIAPYGAYSQGGQFGPGGPADQRRDAPSGWTGAPARGEAEPTFFDPQTGTRVSTGLTGTPPPPAPPAPIPAPVPTDGPPLPAPAAPAEYRRTEYGSPDFEWEPTYSEAPTYEARAEEEQAEEDARREALVHYEASEPRPQYEPPRLDSARHEGWDAGFAEDTLTGTGQPSTDQDGPRYRPIPRAE